jgi:hypothetical protein
MVTQPTASLDARLEAAFSKERLAPYLRAAKGDLNVAIEIYRFNLTVSETLWGVLHVHEVALRNRMHDTLASHFGRADWYAKAPLDQWHWNAVGEALNSLGGRPVPVGKVVAELSLGFWTGLSAGSYQSSLWVPCLHRAFSNSNGNRKQIHAALSDVKALRNRVAHHEENRAAGGQAVRWPSPGKPR